MADLSAFPITTPLAGPASRPAPALFPADAERGQGLDHAGGDRASLRAAFRSISARTRPGRPNFWRSTRTARSPRSSIPTGRAASRSPCSNPARSCSTSPRRPASSCRPIRRGATRRSSGCSSRWRRSDRCSASSASSTNSPAGRSRTSARSSATGAESKRLLGVLETRLEGRDWIMGDDYTIADIATARLGRATWSASTGPRELVEFDSFKRVPAWLERGPRPARPSSAVSRSRSVRSRTEAETAIVDPVIYIGPIPAHMLGWGRKR